MDHTEPSAPTAFIDQITDELRDARVAQLRKAFDAGYAWGYVVADNGGDDHAAAAWETWRNDGTVPERR